MKYPAQFTRDQAGGYVVTFRDIPEAITQGDTLQEALEMAEDALRTSFDFYFEDRREVKAPSKPKKGERLIAVRPSVAVKVALLNAMIRLGVRPVDLARRMLVTPQEVNRIIDLEHRTQIDKLGQAFDALGVELLISGQVSRAKPVEKTPKKKVAAKPAAARAKSLGRVGSTAVHV